MTTDEDTVSRNVDMQQVCAFAYDKRRTPLVSLHMKHSHWLVLIWICHQLRERFARASPDCVRYTYRSGSISATAASVVSIVLPVAAGGGRQVQLAELQHDDSNFATG